MVAGFMMPKKREDEKTREVRLMSSEMNSPADEGAVLRS
jgi:hypothetical protein